LCTFAGLFLIIMSTTLGQVNNAQDTDMAAIKVSLSTDKRIYRLGETVLVTYAIHNVGHLPVYVPKQTSLTASPWGGFEIKVLSPPGASGVGEGSAVDPGPDYFRNRHMGRELEQHWLLLFPGQFFGETTELPYRPLTPGKYGLVAEHSCESLTAAELRSLKHLEHRVLQGRHHSEPVHIQFVRQ
jgi:hypothetical protein